MWHLNFTLSYARQKKKRVNGQKCLSEPTSLSQSLLHKNWAQHWQSPSPPLLLIEAELLSQSPKWPFNRTDWAKRGSPWGLSCFHSIWLAWKGCPIIQQKQIRRDRNSLCSHRTSLQCKAKPRGKTKTKTVFSRPQMKLFTPHANLHTQNKRKSGTAVNIQTLVVYYMQSWAVGLMEPLYKISLFANEEQQSFIFVAFQPQSKSEPNWYLSLAASINWHIKTPQHYCLGWTKLRFLAKSHSIMCFFKFIPPVRPPECLLQNLNSRTETSHLHACRDKKSKRTQLSCQLLRSHSVSGAASALEKLHHIKWTISEKTLKCQNESV